MHIPTAFSMNNIQDQHTFIKEYSFGAVISSSPMQASHLPFFLNENEGDKGVLYAHLAKGNPHWQALDNSQVMVIFTGPHGYISPTWYTKRPEVPTWNYTAVHTYGVASLLDEQDTLIAIEQLITKYEPQLLVSADIVTEQIKHKMLPAIVGIKIELNKLEGKLKLGQNKSADDQAVVYGALSNSRDLGNLSLAKYIQKRHLNEE